MDDVPVSTWRSIGCVDPAALHMSWAIHDSVYNLVARLPPRLRYIIVARYGLDGGRQHFYGEIGQHLGMSGERARQLHTEALIWLRHPPHSQHLRFLLARHTAMDHAFAESEALRWLRRRGGRYDHH